MHRWIESLKDRFELEPATVAPASNDASFRRYFRIAAGRGSCIVMDAPPPQEDCRPFVHAARVLREAGVNVPEVLAEDIEQGFLLLSDFGSTTCSKLASPDWMLRLNSASRRRASCSVAGVSAGSRI